MPVIGFGVPVHESVEAYSFMTLSLTWASWWDLAPADWRLKIGAARGCSVVENRNRIAAELLRDGFGVDGREIPGTDSPRGPLTTRAADVIVWNDSDCFVEPEEYARLVAELLESPYDVGAIGYAFPMQNGRDRPRPNVGRDPGSPLAGQPIEFSAPGPVNLVEVDWIGFGVIATRTSVYRAIAGGPVPEPPGGAVRPYFSHSSGAAGRGEDIGWCRDARACGYRIMADVGVLGTHCYRAPHRLDDFYARGHKD